MFELEVRGTFQRHRAADVDIGRVDFRLREAQEGQQIEGRVFQLVCRNL